MDSDHGSADSLTHAPTQHAHSAHVGVKFVGTRLSADGVLFRYHVPFGWERHICCGYNKPRRDRIHTYSTLSSTPPLLQEIEIDSVS